MPAQANILAARVLSSTGGETELASTRAAWRDLPAHLKERMRNAVLRHALSKRAGRLAQAAAMTVISISRLSMANALCTVVRAGTAPPSSHFSQIPFIASKSAMALR